MRKIIEIDLDSKFEYINEYDDTRISDSLHKYILDSFSYKNDDILLRVKFNYDIAIDEIAGLEEKFRKSFQMKLDKINYEIKKQNIRDIILIVLGFLFLSIYCYLDVFNIFLVSEFFMVISWVAFWEFAESLLFNRRKLISDRKKHLKLLVAEIRVINYYDNL